MKFKIKIPRDISMDNLKFTLAVIDMLTSNTGIDCKVKFKPKKEKKVSGK